MANDTPETDENADEVFLFEKGTTLYALIEHTQHVLPALQRLALGGGPKHSKYYVPIHLKEDLFLLIKKPNRVELKRCKCLVNFPGESWECRFALNFDPPNAFKIDPPIMSHSIA